MVKFSERHGLTPPDASISIRNDAPEALREAIIAIAEDLGFSLDRIRKIVCRTLRKRPDLNNWSDPNIDQEVYFLVHSCEWYRIYDIIEALSSDFIDSEKFETEINKYMHEHGIGWQLVSGEIQTRGEEAFEICVSSAHDESATSKRPTAAQEIHEAIRDLSRRPKPDITGSIQHALAALECTMRDVLGGSKETLGYMLQKNPDVIPPPLNKAVEKIWGFSSERGRHLLEGNEPSWEDAALCVHVSAAVVEYLCRKYNIQAA